MFEILSTLKSKKLKRNEILTEKHYDMNENPNFEQVYWSRTSKVL